MSKSIKLEDLGAAIAQELTMYHQEVVEAVDAAGEKAVKNLVKLTKATAPVGDRGTFKKNITSTTKKDPRGNKHFWHVKPPDSRLTHLIVHGHATQTGGRTKGNPFLQNALDTVLPEYENDVKEALKK